MNEDYLILNIGNKQSPEKKGIINRLFDAYSKTGINKKFSNAKDLYNRFRYLKRKTPDPSFYNLSKILVN